MEEEKVSAGQHSRQAPVAQGLQLNAFCCQLRKMWVTCDTQSAFATARTTKMTEQISNNLDDSKN